MSVGASQIDPQMTDGRISGYVLVERILDRFGDKGVAKLLKCTNHAETEFLEFKTSYALSEEERKKGVSQDALTWDIVQAIFAIANTAGGALLIGICNDGKKMLSVGVGEDPERFLRCTIMQKLLPDQRKWSDGKGGRWSAVGLPRVEPRLCHYSRGKQSGDVVVLLIEPCPRGKCLKFEDDVNRNGKLLCYRKQGCGKTVTNKDSEEFDSIDQNRPILRRHYLTLLKKLVPEAESSQTGKSSGAYRFKPRAGRDMDSCNDELIAKTDGHRLRCEFEKGDRVGKYKIIEKIGQGGMGVVYRVKDTTLRGEYALKAFKSTADDCQMLKERFVTEARALGKLCHIGLPKIYNLDYDSKRECLFLVEDLVVGEDNRIHELSQYTCSQKVTRDEHLELITKTQALMWLRQVCEIVAYLHQRGFAHRDITLKNLLVSKDGQIKLTDFGLVKAMGDELRDQIGANVTATAMQTQDMGTFPYLPPEMRGSGNARDPMKADVWAIGVCFFKLLAGEMFAGQQFEDLEWCDDLWRNLFKCMLKPDSSERITSDALLRMVDEEAGMGPSAKPGLSSELRMTPDDHDLDFLRSCSSYELAPIVAALLGTVEVKGTDGKTLRNENGNPIKDIDRKGRMSSRLDKTAAFCQYYPNHARYVDDIIAELQLYGGDSIANKVRGFGVPYHEILYDVARHMKLKVSKQDALADIERCLMEKIFGKIWSKMSPTEREQLLRVVNDNRGTDINGKAVLELVGSGLLSAGSVATIVASILAEQLLGQGLLIAIHCGWVGSAIGGTVVGGVAMGSLSLAWLGPWGLMLAGLGIVASCTSPAYRVTVPACIYIAALRQLKAGRAAG